MKRVFLKLLVFSLFVVQINTIQAQGLKGALNKVKSTVGEAANKVISSTTSDSSPSEGPAKPLAPEVKNSVSQLRSYTGLTKAAFETKIKSLGFSEAVDDIGLGGTVYKSKKSNYALSVIYGTRNGEMVVRDITKGFMSKKPVISALKTEFLDYSKQCADLKTKFEEAFVRPNDRKSLNKASVRNLENREAKYLPALNKFVTANEDGSIFERYSEPDYDYNVGLMYSKLGSMSLLTVRIIDKTIDTGGEV
jgi:hypothetical protein